MTEHHHTADEVLRDRLAAADPAKRVSINPIPDQLMEHIMTNTTNPAPSTSPSTAPSTAPRPHRRWMPLALGGVAAAAAVAVVIGVTTLDGDNSTVTATPLELTGAGGDVMASCMPFAIEFLDDMVTAFEGTVTTVDGATVTLEIDRWYRDGTGSAADTVIVNAPEGMESLIGGIAFEPGGQYLISADANGNVSYCGFSAPATDDLRASFDQAFPG